MFVLTSLLSFSTCAQGDDSTPFPAEFNSLINYIPTSYEADTIYNLKANYKLLIAIHYFRTIKKIIFITILN